MLPVLNTAWGGEETVADYDSTKALGSGDIDGPLRQYMVMGADEIVPAPRHLSFEEAATVIGVYSTAWSALYGGPQKLSKGDWVVVQGSGGVSVATLQASVLNFRTFYGD